MLLGGNNTPWAAAASTLCSESTSPCWVCWGSPFLLQSQIWCLGISQNQGSPVSARELLVPLLFPHFLLQKPLSVPPRRAARLSIGCGMAAAFRVALEKVQEDSLRVSRRALPVSDGSAGAVCHPPVPCAAGGLIAQHLPNLISCRNLPAEDLLLLFRLLNPPDSGEKSTRFSSAGLLRRP